MSRFRDGSSGMTWVPKDDEPEHDPSRNGAYRGRARVHNIRPGVTGEEYARLKAQGNLKRVEADDAGTW